MKPYLASVLILSLCSFGVAYADWYNEDWTYGKQITINGTLAEGSFLDFPILVNITDSDLQSKANSDGTDILFTLNNVTKLDHEIESYDSSTGHLVAWVEVDLLTGDDQTLTMYYGDTGSNGQQNNTQGTWHERYMGVWHLDGDFKDSTSYQNHATNDGSTEANCIIGKCRTFDEVNDSVLMGKGIGQYNFTAIDEFTVQLLGNWDSTASDTTVTALGYFQGFGGGYRLYVDNTLDQGKASVITISTSEKIRRTPSQIPQDEWMWMAYSWMGINHTATNPEDFNQVQGRLFFNGTVWQQYSADSYFTNDIQDEAELRIGESASNNQQWKGELDEVRITNEILTDEWLLTEYNNQQTHTTNEFLIIGTEGTKTDSRAYDTLDLRLHDQYRNHLAYATNLDVQTTDLDRNGNEGTPVRVEIPLGNTANVELIDEGSFSVYKNGFKCMFDGRVKATGQAYITNTGTQRTNNELQVLVNNQTVGSVGATGYIRQTSGHDHTSLHTMAVFECDRNDVITLSSQREALAGTVYLASEGTSFLLVERIGGGGSTTAGGSSGFGGEGHVIQDEGIDLMSRPNLDFIGDYVTASDTPTATTVTITGDNLGDHTMTQALDTNLQNITLGVEGTRIAVTCPASTGMCNREMLLANDNRETLGFSTHTNRIIGDSGDANTWNVFAHNDIDERVTYHQVQWTVNDNTDGTEDARLEFWMQDDGVLTEIFEINGNTPFVRLNDADLRVSTGESIYLDDGDSVNDYIQAQNDGTIRFVANGSSSFWIEGGNIGVGGSMVKSDGFGVLIIHNNNAPTTPNANEVYLYSADVAGSAELHTMDEAGNITVLSPHAFDHVDRQASMDWAFKSENSYIGKGVSVSWYEVLRALEKVTGDTLIHEYDLPPDQLRDWDADQIEIKKLHDEFRNKMILHETDLLDRKAFLESELLTTTSQEYIDEIQISLKGINQELTQIEIPDAYIIKPRPAYFDMVEIRTP